MITTTTNEVLLTRKYKQLYSKIGTILQGAQQTYVLTGVVVHEGSTPGHGHYITYLRTLSGWYEINDDQVN